MTRLRRKLAPYANDLAEAAETTDDPIDATAYAFMYAIACGEPIPPDVKRRFREHFGGNQ